MATNLRLTDDAAAAVKAEAKRSGRSQQDVIRAAIDQYLAAKGPARHEPWRESLIPPERPYEVVPESEMLKMPEGLTSLDLLDRDDRLQP